MAWGHTRCRASWQVNSKVSVHAGGGITIIPPNIWQDNFLTGSTPFAVYPRLLSASNAPISYGVFQTTSIASCPQPYTPAGVNIFANGNPKSVAPNTVMDVNRYEQDVAALTPNGAVSALNLSGVDRNFGNGTLYTWTTGVERKLRANLTADAGYVGTASAKLPRTSFPNAYPGATAAFRAPHAHSTAPVECNWRIRRGERRDRRNRPLHLSRPANFALRNHGSWRAGHPGKLHLG